MLGKSIALVKKQRGFTLVEVMIVLVIIGIIAAIAVPKLSGFTTRAKRQACEANIKAIETAVAAYSAAQDGDIPGDLGDIGEYLREKPKCPLGGEYTFQGDGSVSCNHGGETHEG